MTTSLKMCVGMPNVSRIFWSQSFARAFKSEVVEAFVYSPAVLPVSKKARWSGVVGGMLGRFELFGVVALQGEQLVERVDRLALDARALVDLRAQGFMMASASG